MNQSARRFTLGVRRTVLAALALTALGTTAALANPIQASWGFDMYGQFNTGNTSFYSGTGCTYESTTILRWGDTNNNSSCTSKPASSLVLAPTSGGTPANAPFPADPFAFSTGTVFTDAAAINPGISLTHNNITINGNDPTLNQTEFDTLLYLTPPADSGLANPVPLNFNISFWETPNNPDKGGCAEGSTPCGDIFVLVANSINQAFQFDGNTYFLSLFPTTAGGGFSTLNHAACSHFGVADGCLGWVTKEAQSNQMIFGLSITARPIGVPEPGILGMMGLGLLGIGLGGYALRRRKLSVHS